MFARFKEICINVYIIEFGNFFAWIPLFLCLGIAIFFGFSYDPGYLELSCILFLCAVSAAIFYYVAHKELALLILCIAIGFAASYGRIAMLDNNALDVQLDRIYLEGDISQIFDEGKVKKIVLSNLYLDFPLEYAITKIKLTDRTKSGNLEIGDRIGVYANLLPPPLPAIHNGFNFSFHNYFKQIGAIAVAVSRPQIIEKRTTSSFADKVNILRSIIGTRIENVLNDQEAAIAKALIVGDTSQISDANFSAIRASGIAHIIAISGLHIVTVVAAVFIFSRSLLGRIPYLVLHYDLKKFAALISILISFGYLLISGMPVSAQRAFLMSSIVMLAIVLDRNSDPLRALSLSAVVVLLFAPESLFLPSFQMSFSACFALIASYNYSSKRLKSLDGIFYGKYLRYAISLILATLIAGTSTTPFVVYHFNQYSTYSILTNLFVIPISDFVIMPFAAIGTILMIVGLEYIPIQIMGLGVKAIIYIAVKISALPMASLYIPSPSSSGIALIGFCLFVACIAKSNLRILAMILLMFSSIASLSYTKPDIVLSGNIKLFAFKNEKGDYVFSNLSSARFIRSSWQQSLGIKNPVKMKDSEFAECVKDNCVFQLKGFKILLDRGDISGCDADLIINFSNVKSDCSSAVIDKDKLFEDGTHEVFLSDDGIVILQAKDGIKRRKWNDVHFR